MPGHVAQWFRSGEDAHEAQFTHGPLGFLYGLVGIVQRDHGDALEPLWIGLAEIVEPVVVGSRDRRGELRIHFLAHHDTEADGWIEGGDVKPFSIHRMKLGRRIEAARAILGDFFIDAGRIEDAATVSRLVTLQDFSLDQHHCRAAGGGSSVFWAPVRATLAP